MDKYVINGTAMRLDARDAQIINYGTIMHLNGTNVEVKNTGTIMHNEGSGRVIYRDRVVYRDRYVSNPEAEAEVKRLKAELEATNKKLDAANKETRRLSQRIREMEIAPKTGKTLQHTEELLECALEVNRRQAERIRDLERGVCDAYLRQQIDPWDMRPTRNQCETLLKMFNSYIEGEEDLPEHDFSTSIHIEQ